MQGFLSESSRTVRSHELQIPGTLGGRTWAKWGAAIGVVVGGGIVILAPHLPLSPLLLLSVRLRLIRLMSASLIVVPLSASPILVMDCLEVSAVVLIMAELVAVVSIYFAEVSPRRLHGDATSRDTS